MTTNLALIMNNLHNPCCLRELLEKYEIVIPLLQRDYAQGRPGNQIKDIRKRFLQDLYRAVNNNGIILDFVYGEATKDEFIPLDGQQRLTTLFLLHWYAVKKGLYKKHIELGKFTYETHPTTRQFCEKLINDKELLINKGHKISKQIQETSKWWIAKWKDDPSISSMLTMLDDINDSGFAAEDIEELNLDEIKFHFINVETFGLTDETYIKMNSRSLPLTPFERIKGVIIKGDSDIAKKAAQMFDQEWTAMLWSMISMKDGGENSGQTLDKYFLNYIRYVCDTFLLTHGRKRRNLDAVRMIDEALEIPDNKFLHSLVDRFNMWYDVWKPDKGDKIDGIAQMFNKWLCTRENEEKLTINGIFNKTNLFLECCERYSSLDDSNTININFKNKEVVLFYAFETYMLHAKNSDEVEGYISEDDFRKRLRWVRNLIWNSHDSNENLSEQLIEAESIICSGLPKKANAFNEEQLKQESDKEDWIQNMGDEYRKALYALEDHPLIQGDVSVVKEWKDPIKCRRFCNLFQMEENNNDIKKYKLLTRALLSMGPIWHGDGFWGGKERYRITIKTREHFREFRKDERTRFALDQLLSECEESDKLESCFDDNFMLKDYKKRMESYLKKVKSMQSGDISADWNYYFAKYKKIIDASSLGYFVWRDNDILAIQGRRISKNHHFWDIILLGIEDAMSKEKRDIIVKVKEQPSSKHNSESRMKITTPAGISYEMYREVRKVEESEDLQAYFVVTGVTDKTYYNDCPIDTSRDCVQQGVEFVNEICNSGHLEGKR